VFSSVGELRGTRQRDPGLPAGFDYLGLEFGVLYIYPLVAALGLIGKLLWDVLGLAQLNRQLQILSYQVVESCVLKNVQGLASLIVIEFYA